MVCSALKLSFHVDQLLQHPPKFVLATNAGSKGGKQTRQSMSCYKATPSDTDTCTYRALTPYLVPTLLPTATWPPVPITFNPYALAFSLSMSLTFSCLQTALNSKLNAPSPPGRTAAPRLMPTGADGLTAEAVSKHVY